MASKVKLNKNSLREQNQALRLYREFLPTLDLRKQQLQAELRTAQKRIEAAQKRLEELLEGAGHMAPMLQSILEEVKPLIVLEKVVTRTGNVAGVRVPVFETVRFHHVPYSLIATPPFMDSAVEFFKKALAARAEIGVLEEQARALEHQLIKTTQRINLYEKVLIPECREAIRRIKVYLGDLQTAGVCRAKIAKAKIVRSAEAEAARLGS